MCRPAPSLQLVERVVAAEAAYTLSRLQVLERLPGNPVRVAYRQPAPGLLALMARHLPVPSFNSVVGLRSGQEEHIEPLVAWYRDNSVAPRFEIVPGLGDAKLCRELSRLGLHQSGFHAALACAPSAIVPHAGDPAIEAVRDAAGLENFLDAHAAGWRIPDPRGFKANVRGWLGQPGWFLYLARVDGQPAATGILFLHGKTGYCADSTTHPDFRGRSLQQAMLRRRIADAAAAGADLLCSGAEYLSTSHRNMERVGLRVQFTRAIWTAT